ncbi:hypothetical protein GCM10025868_13020 [Angustibacter aerolatus]|uniref:GlcNAc-PI de-N-acetylase n=1 Tax=Angustibacter aerolatus TaxID=1162965 RepID=A0ABQ6JCY9_9ACTN|nr:hypothetical protein [Angustibacter aerolatus]GMA86052.1 hypothetical protein GCM10025868_13020 [Angustibacter aerolatus]
MLRERRPHVVVTYDPDGGYRHPDHVQAHRVTVRAVELAAPEWRVPRLLWVQVPLGDALDEREQVREAAASAMLPEPLLPGPDADGWPPAVADDDAFAVVVDAPTHLTAKSDALAAHATQVRVAPPWYALSNGEARLLTAREGYVLGAGEPVPDAPASDLFAGLAVDDDEDPPTTP